MLISFNVNCKWLTSVADIHRTVLTCELGLVFLAVLCINYKILPHCNATHRVASFGKEQGEDELCKMDTGHVA